MENETIKNEFPISIKCQLDFVVVGKIDTRDECFNATIKITSKWIDNKIITSYNPDTDWNSKIYIENAIPDVNYFQDAVYKLRKLEEKTEITEIRTIKGTY